MGGPHVRIWPWREHVSDRGRQRAGGQGDTGVSSWGALERVQRVYTAEGTGLNFLVLI